MMRLVSCVLLSLFVGACATAPTKVKETVERKRDEAGVSQSMPIKITPQTIIVDARPAFEYSTAHVPGSVNMQWRSFTDPERSGELHGDHFALARRLSWVGINPESHVVVVGNGLRGNGEEGRIAWMLSFLGVKNVQFAELDSLNFRLTNLVEENRPKSIPMWKPRVLESLVSSREEVIFVINKKGVHQPVSFEKGSPPVLYRFIDVRSEDDYLGREGFGARQPVPNMDAINIPWREFFHPSMRVKTEMAVKLKEVGILPQHRIIVLSDDGVSSAAVTMALRALGYRNSANYAGGLADLLSRR